MHFMINIEVYFNVFSPYVDTLLFLDLNLCQYGECLKKIVFVLFILILNEQNY